MSHYLRPIDPDDAEAILNSLSIEINDEEAYPSSPGAHSSSPQLPPVNIMNPRNLSFRDLDLPDEETDVDDNWELSDQPEGGHRRVSTADETKVLQVLDIIKTSFTNHFMFLAFLRIMLTSDLPAIRQYSRHIFSASNVDLFETFAFRVARNNADFMSQWVVGYASDICSKEPDQLTRESSRGPVYDIGKRLRVSSSDVTLEMIWKSHLRSLQKDYDDSLTYLQLFLKKTVAGGEKIRDGSENGLLMATSILLNVRSQKSNYHQLINGLVLWENRVSKRIFQALNQYSVCSSHRTALRASDALSKDITACARRAALNPTQIKLLVYDNFSWQTAVYEASQTHGKVSHDQVSGLLVCVDQFSANVESTAPHLTNVLRFDGLEGARTRMDPVQALEDIIPSARDQRSFIRNATIHVGMILHEELDVFSKFRYPKLSDPFAITPHITEVYHLPPLDQEQSSTRGNMVVLQDYFLKVLKVPLEIFEQVMFFVLGDRLTVARDCAAQDQRALDHTPYQFKHFQSFKMLNGLMHECMNMIKTIGKNAWGMKSAENAPLSLRSLLQLPVLSNQKDLNLKKLDYYAWLRFLDLIGRSLILAVTMAEAGVNVLEDFGKLTFTQESFDDLCHRVAAKYIVTSPDRLEVEGVKKIDGSTMCGNTVILNHNLMTLREMRHAIMHGHPLRILSILKYWAPMFYTGGGFNYAQETMEILHNVTHDWPKDSASVLLAGMLCNTQGNSDSFKECDLLNEHCNKTIKDHIDGANTTPTTLQHQSPALGHLQVLRDTVYSELGVERANQKHMKVSQSQRVLRDSLYPRQIIMPLGHSLAIEHASSSSTP
ncbi:hypothetical protein PM082_006158 [Marasmius tenuissimus]|nr:hypothetical protein PM082_006158 [Marasmius tenuissimus]